MVKMSTETYVMVSKPIQFKKFEKFTAPMGWIRIDILKRKLKDKDYRTKFTQTELKKIKDVK